MAAFDRLEIYREVKDMSKEFRYSISNMPRFYKFGIGSRILGLLIDIKYQIYLCNSRRGENKLEAMHTLREQLTFLKILIDECLEDKVLLLKTKFSIQQPLRRLHNIISQSIKWEKYTQDVLVRDNKLNKDKIEEDLPF